MRRPKHQTTSGSAIIGNEKGRATPVPNNAITTYPLSKGNTALIWLLFPEKGAISDLFYFLMDKIENFYFAAQLLLEGCFILYLSGADIKVAEA